jgi:hypothetical protein
MHLSILKDQQNILQTEYDLDIHFLFSGTYQLYPQG